MNVAKEGLVIGRAMQICFIFESFELYSFFERHFINF